MRRRPRGTQNRRSRQSPPAESRSPHRRPAAPAAQPGGKPVFALAAFHRPLDAKLGTAVQAHLAAQFAGRLAAHLAARLEAHLAAHLAARLAVHLAVHLAVQLAACLAAHLAEHVAAHFAAHLAAAIAGGLTSASEQARSRGAQTSGAALCYSNGKRATMYGKGGHGLSWRERPSYSVMAGLVLASQHAEAMLVK